MSELTALRLGDKVHVTWILHSGVWVDPKGVAHRVLESQNVSIDGIYLGRTTRQTGIIAPGREYGGPEDSEPRYAEPYLSHAKTHSVVVVQPIDKNGRYRKSVIAYPVDVEATHVE